MIGNIIRARVATGIIEGGKRACCRRFSGVGFGVTERAGVGVGHTERTTKVRRDALRRYRRQVG
jgi:hypothetical protein